MKVFVTGGAGFIGKYLTQSLIEKNHFVTIFDNFSNSSKESLSNLVYLGVKVIEGDITNASEIEDSIKNHDIVIHLAAKISVDESVRNPSETFHVNVDGTKNILEACEKNHIKKLIVASSAAVYGESRSSSIRLTEGAEKVPVSPYGESKLRMEQEIREFESKHDINCIILRFFNIYGVGQTSEYAGVITKFMERITHGESLEIFGDGLQTRDFIAIDDVITSIHNAISNGNSGTYNIASGRATTIKALAEQMIILSNKKLQIKYSAAKKGEIRYSQADISMAEKELGFLPEFRLDGIKKLLE